MSLLQFVLLRWCPDVVAMSRILQVTVISGASGVRFGAQNVVFGMLGSTTLAPWGTIERSRGTEEHKKGDVGIQAWISIEFGWISGPHVESRWPLFNKMCIFCHACLQVTFFNDFGGLHLDVWGSRIKRLL